MDAGAYGMSLTSNYNSRPRPAEDGPAWVAIRSGDLRGNGGRGAAHG